MTVVSVSQPSILGTIAHELRGPLNALQMTSELLDRDLETLEPQQVKAMVASMHRRALWLRELMENLLASASATDGRLQVTRRVMDIRSVLDDVRPVVDPLLARKQQRLRVRSRTALPFVAADARRLAQVLINLITNACKYSGINTTIDLNMTVRAGQVRVTVADQGPGIAAEFSRRIFEPYERAGRTDSDGIGIGLSVVRSIIEAHGGRVGVKKRAAGGACFWFELAPVEGLSASLSGDIKLFEYERRLG
jgi:K+-sensing histidine kinase KdpD